MCVREQPPNAISSKFLSRQGPQDESVILSVAASDLFYRQGNLGT